jgi:hypothetical protein
MPAGTRLRVGTAEVEVTAEPHLGCSKFRARFGTDALVLFNRPEGRALRLRGANARIVTAGVVRPGDAIVKLGDAATGADDALEGTSWHLVSGEGTISTLTFAEGRAAGSAGVNRYTGAATTEGERLTFGSIAVTRMAGPAEAMAAEDAFLAALSATAGWAVEDGLLVLRDTAGTTLLRLTAGEP